jgi:hypothetical protein
MPPHTQGLCLGTVVDRDDPDRLARVRVQIPGLVESASGWAWPLGTVGGGASNRGLIAVPPIGATVAVWFHQGDLSEPYYLSGPWGAPDGASELPAEADASPPDNHVWATPTFTIQLDERAGQRRLALTNRATGDRIVMDGETNQIAIEATTDLRLSAYGRIALEAVTITLNGRVVSPSPKPI